MTVKPRGRPGERRSEGHADNGSGNTSPPAYSELIRLQREQVEWLLEEYGGAGKIPKLTDRDKAREKRSGIPASTWANLRNGKGAALGRKTKGHLADMMKTVIPQFDPDWFELPDMESFKKAVRSTAKAFYIPLRASAPSSERMKQFLEWLPGLYVCYRYSFQGKGKESAAREVLWVFYDASAGCFKFEMYYVDGDGASGAAVKVLAGSVVAAGDMLMFVGASEDRARSFFWVFEEAHWKDSDRFCRFAIVASARSQYGLAPVAACTIFIKVDGSRKDWSAWWSSPKGVVGVVPLAALIESDFPGPCPEGREFDDASIGYWIRKFLENKPMDKSQTASQVEDDILRLNLERFRLRMEGIRVKLISDSPSAIPFSDKFMPPEEQRRPRARDRAAGKVDQA